MDALDIYNNLDKYKKIALFGVIAVVVIFVISSDANYYSKNNG